MLQLSGPLRRSPDILVQLRRVEALPDVPVMSDLLLQGAAALQAEILAGRSQAALGSCRGRAQPAGEPSAEPFARGRRSALILVVDDEADVQRMAAVAVELLGFGVLRASNGEEGLALVKSHRPDVVLTDAFMPKMDGREMFRLIKADPEISSVPVVIMTSLYTASRYKYGRTRNSERTTTSRNRSRWVKSRRCSGNNSHRATMTTGIPS